MQDEWYVKTHDGIYGPYSARQLKQFGDDGFVRAGYQVRKGKDGDWVKAESVRGLKIHLPVAVRVPPAVPQVAKPSRVADRARASRTSPGTVLSFLAVPLLALVFGGSLVLFSNWSDSTTSRPEYTAGRSAEHTVENSVNTGRTQSVREIVQANEQSVLLLRGAVGSGTGFVVENQLLVTNSHVIAAAVLDLSTGEFKDLRAYCPAAEPSRRGPFRVSLLYEDRDWDLAVLKIKEPVKFRPVSLARNYEFQRGEAVTIIGNPGLFEGRETLETAVSTGILSTTHPLDGREHYQLGAAVNGGNSGGPVFGENGQVIGVVVAKSLSEDEISFCIPVRQAIAAVDRAGRTSLLGRQAYWQSHNDRVPQAIANMLVPSGSVVMLANPPWSFVMVARNGDDLMAAWEHAYAGNVVGMQQLIDSGRVMMVDAGTQVQVLESNLFCQVQILNGQYAGRTGLVSVQCLK